MRFALIFALCLLCPALASLGFAAQGAALIDIARPSVNVTSGFSGTSIQVYGVRANARDDVIITVKGPSKDMQVRRKGYVWGAWFNREAVTFMNVPTFYDYALSNPEISKDILQDLKILPTSISRSFKKSPKREDVYYERFFEALVRNKARENLYPLAPQDIKFFDNMFFKVEFLLPDNVPIGSYDVNVMHLRGGKIVKKAQEKFEVAQVGMSGSLHEFSRNEALIYGIMCVFLALLAGWVSNRLRSGS